MNTQQDKPIVHFTDPDLIESVHPILINLIGAGGTGSHVIRSLADMNQTLLSLGHPGFAVRVFDVDTVSEFNLGRQRFADAEIGRPKAAALVDRINRFYGTAWQAMLYPYSMANRSLVIPYLSAQLTISCVDTVASRFDIDAVLKSFTIRPKGQVRERPAYWLDFGNSRVSGQVILSTLRPITQPDTKRYVPVSALPLFTDEYKTDLQSVVDTHQPSCSMAEALGRQDLFINSTLALMGCRLLWTLLSDGLIKHRGVFINIAEYRTIPVPISLPLEMAGDRQGPDWQTAA